MDQLEKLFQSKNYRLTNPRKQVFIALEKADHPLSLIELSSLTQGIDRTSIYRTLELFNELEIIAILHVGWKKRYELASPFQPHHHHLQCTQCNKIIAIDIPALEDAVEDFAHSRGFSLTSHSIELFGICAGCKNDISIAEASKTNINSAH